MAHAVATLTFLIAASAVAAMIVLLLADYREAIVAALRMEPATGRIASPRRARGVSRTIRSSVAIPMPVRRAA